MTESSLLHTGHRQRMREKIITHGSFVMQSYELIEMLLYHVIPCKDTNATAKRLMLRFGSVDGVFSATKEELLSVEGLGPMAAELIIKVGELMNDSQSVKSDYDFDNYERLGEFLVEKFSYLTASNTAILLFDNKMKLIDFKIISENDYSSAAIKPAEFVDYAVNFRASISVTAHNHPHGPLFPTVGDMATHTMLKEALGLSGIELAEHYVICGKKYAGLTCDLSLSFSQAPALVRFFESKEAYLNAKL